jgi:hypothetical protein
MDYTEKKNSFGFSRTWGISAGRGRLATFDTLSQVKKTEKKSYRTADKVDCRLLKDTFE